MCGGTIWTLVFKRSTHRVNRKMLTVACMLPLFSTVHIVTNMIRVIQGLILYRDSYKGGPIGYFSDLSQWTFVAKNHVFTAQTLIGDGVVPYRCYLVWQSKLVMILPVLLWCTVATTGIATTYTASKVTHDSDKIFGGTISQWIASFFATTLATNILTTLLLASRIWYIDRKVRRLYVSCEFTMWPILQIIIDAGVIYSLTLWQRLFAI
ncbi:hypothetical protein OG21DRAFT_1497832 [Imleria badia]|nr:hypothetical protein OG21DRAFT_1497832 [Imleria badia]